MGTTDLIRGLLVSNPSKRLTASQAVLKAHDIIVVEQNMMTDTNLQAYEDSILYKLTLNQSGLLYSHIFVQLLGSPECRFCAQMLKNTIRGSARFWFWNRNI